MKVLIIGNLGYIGPMVAKHFRATHPDAFLAGYDIGYFVQNNTFNGIAGDTLLNVQHFGDVRNFDEQLLNGFDAVIYLAAISNDPMGNAFETPTLDINYKSAVHIAQKAKDKGVKHFVFASSCSVYGFADSAARTETSEVNPLTAYAKSKVFSEEGLKPLADDKFHITCLRFATACGYSDRLRLDLVLNDFVASAIADKKITIRGHFLIINTGSNAWNYQVKRTGSRRAAIFTDVDVSINENAQPDKRSYKVSFDLYEKLAPAYQPQVSLQHAVEDLKKGLQGIDFKDANFRQSSLIRLKTIQKLIDHNIIDQELALK
ncbi:MAG: NAD-dependent epimerase/dehydratase family protein [Chitinophagaceae bacterium]|nr:NAD-dependent epimerase/dehydratase family protein [Chitinophagaceae bacterium]